MKYALVLLVLIWSQVASASAHGGYGADSDDEDAGLVKWRSITSHGWSSTPDVRDKFQCALDMCDDGLKTTWSIPSPRASSLDDFSVQWQEEVEVDSSILVKKKDIILAWEPVGAAEVGRKKGKGRNLNVTLTIVSGKPVSFNNLGFRGVNQLAVVMDDKASSYVSAVYFESVDGHMWLNGIVNHSKFKSWTGFERDAPFLASNVKTVTVCSVADRKAGKR